MGNGKFCVPEQQVLRLVREKPKSRDRSQMKKVSQSGGGQGLGKEGRGRGSCLHASELQFRKGL